MDDVFRVSGFGLGIVGLWLCYWFLLSDRARGRKRCPMCWYDMSVADSLRCPECGHDANREADLLKTRRRFKGLWLCMLVFLTAGFLWIQPRVQQHGWVSVMPSTALILCLRLGDTQALFAELDRRTQINVSGEFNTYFPGMLVTDPESLYQWQWRLVGNACVELKKGILMSWIVGCFCYGCVAHPSTSLVTMRISSFAQCCRFLKMPIRVSEATLQCIALMRDRWNLH